MYGVRQGAREAGAVRRILLTPPGHPAMEIHGALARGSAVGAIAGAERGCRPQEVAGGPKGCFS